MKLEIKKLPKSKIELSFEVEVEELKPYVSQAVQNISKQLNIPGFRPGHAPQNIVEREVGEFKIWEEMARLALPRIYVKTILDKKIEAIGEPEIKVEKIAPKNPLVFSATVAYLSPFSLPDYQKIKIKREKISVKKEEIDDLIKNLQKSRAKLIPVNREARSGDGVEIDFKTYLDKVPIDYGEGKNHQLVISEGRFVPGFEDKLIGMKVGDKKEFSVRFPRVYHQKNLAGRDVEFAVEMKKISERKLPEVNDEFAKSLGKFKNLTELKGKMEENLVFEAEEKEKSRLQEEIMEKISKKTEMEIPEVLILGEIEKMFSELKNMVSGAGGEYEKYLKSIKKTEEDLKKDFSSQAEKRVRAGLILREIARREKIEASDEEIKKEREKTLQHYQYDKKIMEQIQSANYKEYVKGLIQNRKVFKRLMELMVN
jgi:trigger factor